MEITNNILANERKSALWRATILLFYAIVGFLFVGPFFGYVLVTITDLNFHSSNNIEINKDNKSFILILQSCATMGMFLLPFLYDKFKYQSNYYSYCEKRTNIRSLLIALLIVVSFTMVNSWIIEWNANLSFPENMQNVERFFRNMENMAENSIKLMTDFNNFYDFLIALFVMAMLPAIAEEFIFRGVIQKKLILAYNNPHIGIWVSAFLFSTIHMQIFGLLPRMLLGAIFGYLYYWSKDLKVSMFCHFINNANVLLLIYLGKLEIINYDFNDYESPPILATICFIFITFSLIYYFYKLQRSSVNV